MYRSILYSFEAIFRLKLDVPREQVIESLSEHFPPVKSDKPRKAEIYIHRAEYTDPQDKVSLTIRIVEDRLTVRASVAPKEKDSEVSPNPELALEFIRKAHRRIPLTVLRACSFEVFSALDLEGEGKPAVGERLFSLNVRPFGAKYDTALMFSWDRSEWPVPVVTKVFPMDTQAGHIHYACSLNIPESVQQADEDTPTLGLAFFEKSWGTAVPLVEDVFRR